MSEVGRPTKYKEEYNEQARKLCLLGATNEELASFFNVHVDTIDEWKNVHEEFSDAIKSGKELADAKVVEALFKRATGYRVKEVHVEAITRTVSGEEAMNEDFLADEGNGFNEIKVVHKEIAPDPTSIIFWLKNRQPRKWRDKRDVDMTSGGEPINTPVIQWISADTDKREVQGPMDN